MVLQDSVKLELSFSVEMSGQLELRREHPPSTGPWAAHLI